MKLGYLLFTCLFIFFFGIIIRAQIILDPGDVRTFSNQSATGGEEGDNGNFTYNLNASFDVTNKIVKAQANGLPISQFKGEAYALIYYDFQVAETPETHNNTVGAWINYSVYWKGYQALIGLATLIYANAKIEFSVIDLTANQTLRNDIVYDYSVHQYSYDFLAAGFSINENTGVNTFSVYLIRGHNYRLQMKLTTTIFDNLGWCDYMDGFAGGGDGRVELNRLFVKVGLDEKETLEKLASIDSLESRIDTLEYRLEHHYHTYLTGRGAGHNNTEANTTLSIFEESSQSNTDPPQYDTQPDLNSDESGMNNSTPEEFSLGQNYPNPFNPNTKIAFDIPAQEFVAIKVYDILGREIKSLVNETKSPGYYEINFNAENLPSGTYIYEIRAGKFVETKKMILLK